MIILIAIAPIYSLYSVKSCGKIPGLCDILSALSYRADGKKTHYTNKALTEKVDVCLRAEPALGV